MDKSWINLTSRRNERYIDGVINFLRFAFERSSKDGEILCPCVKCGNTHWHSRAIVFDHLICDGFLKGYTKWTLHGEPSDTGNLSGDYEGNDSGMHDMLNDLFPHATEAHGDEGNGQPMGNTSSQAINVNDLNIFHNMQKYSEELLYPSCGYSKLSAIIHLYHIKCLNGWSNKSFTMLLEYLQLILPEGNKLPKSFSEMKRLISALGLHYEKIHVCPNNCMLFWKDKAHEDRCLKCNASRWKATVDNGEDEMGCRFSKKQKRIPEKVLRWFPLKPRLQRLFMSSKIASHMKWHDQGRTKDGLLRHPADSQAWKEFDSNHLEFSSEPRNVRLALASDGFNPFKTMNVSHSTWPVILIPYNLPPWMCMKQSNFMLSLLIPGPKGPGVNFDVFMQPLIEELKSLWEVGIETYDASTKDIFRLRAALLWTISDFPAYANLSGWSTKGKYACPSCSYGTQATFLHHGHKYCYMGHRRWLDPHHKYRHDEQSFDGTQEFRCAPIPPSGDEILEQLEGITNDEVEYEGRNWKTKSIFFTLPYWKDHLLRHNFDVMHIEKNVCDNIIGTLLEKSKKSKDNLKARLDLQDMGIRSVLHPRKRSGSDQLYIPRACYHMTLKEKDAFLKVLKEMKVPDEYTSNVSRCVDAKQRKLIGLKSYDCHLLMQEFIPIAIRGSLPDNVSSIIIQLCNLFKELCSKVLDVEELQKLENRAVLILCELEKIFPPSFFTIMVHLVIHLPREAKLAGPVIYRWMYPIERFLLTLKNYVRNRAHPEGSIAETYLAHECLTLCSRYLDGVETQFNRNLRNADNEEFFDDDDELVIPLTGRPLGKKRTERFQMGKRKRVARIKLDKHTLTQAHRYVLFNCDEVAPFRKEHVDFIKRRHRPKRLSQYEIDRIQSQTFHEWFGDRVSLLEEQKKVVTDQIRWLARGPCEMARRYTGYIINGFRFHTKHRESSLKTQNSGVLVTTETMSYASSRDKRPIEGEVNYYGVLRDIIELNYFGRFKIVLFKCDWVDVNRGCKKDKFGLTLVNLSYLVHKGDNLVDDPFILASQAKKVFYVTDDRHKDWSVVKHVKLREVFDMGNLSVGREEQVAHVLDSSFDTSHNASIWTRGDHDDDEVDVVAGTDEEDFEDNELDEQ